MLLTISTTHAPATDLGYLLHKNPSRAQSVELSFGRAHVFYPEASAERCTVAMALDVDPVGLVRGRRGPEGDGGLRHHPGQLASPDDGERGGTVLTWRGHDGEPIEGARDLSSRPCPGRSRSAARDRLSERSLAVTGQELGTRTRGPHIPRYRRLRLRGGRVESLASREVIPAARLQRLRHAIIVQDHAARLRHPSNRVNRTP